MALVGSARFLQMKYRLIHTKCADHSLDHIVTGRLDYVVSTAAGGLKFFCMFGPLAISHMGPLEMRIVCFVQNCDISSCHNSPSQPREQFLKRDFAFVSRYNLSGPVLARYHC